MKIYIKKNYLDEENTALNLPYGYYEAEAVVIHVNQGEVVCVINNEENTEEIIFGPKSKILGPNETVKVLSLSAGKPKQTNQIKAAIIRIGPDYMSDNFQVRTKDNAQLDVHVSYKWQFLVDKDDIHKVFVINDFIGYACQSLCSSIREEAAKYTFEEFHNSTVQLVRKSLFKENVVKYENSIEEKIMGVYFPENKFLVSEIDVKTIEPVNQEISSLLNQSIKSNMVIVCKRMEQSASLQAQKEKVKAQSDLQLLKEKLISVLNTNLELETVEKAKIEGSSLIEKAKAEKESNEIKAKGNLSNEIETMKQIMELLDSEEGKKYLELMKIENFSKIPQEWYITSDSKFELI